MNIKNKVYPYIPNYLKFGVDYFKTYQNIIDFHNCSEDEKQHKLNVRITSVVGYAYENIPFYKKFYDDNLVDIKAIKGIEELVKLPIVNKQTIYDYALDMVDYSNNDNLLIANTGGSTGEPLKLYRTKVENAQEYAYLDFYIAKALNKRNIFNVNKVIIRGNTPENFLVKRYGCNLVISSHLLSESNISEVSSAISKFKPSIIHAYPSSILKYINLSLANNSYRPSLDLVLTSSECITSNQLDLISKFFGCKTLDLYGNSERSALALNINNNCYDFDMSYGYTELASSGFIISTKLLNSPMPLIRYDCGDLYLSNDILLSSRSSLQLKKIGGRSSDFLISHDGNEIPVVAIIFGVHYCFFDFVDDFSLVQMEKGTVEIEYIAQNLISPLIMRKDIFSMSNQSNGTLTCTFRRVERIRRKINGKKDFLFRNINNND